jgi:hypothetical protein
MPGKSQPLRFLALLLGIVFLAAQFHLCADLNSGASNSHPCPVCSVAGSVIVADPPVIAFVPVANALEILLVVDSPSAVLPHATSPRAPPAL